MAKKTGKQEEIKNSAQTYTQSLQTLEKIITELESNQDSIDEIMPKLEKAMKIIESCERELKGYNVELQKISNNINNSGLDNNID